MISQKQILTEMERQLQMAKRAGDERTVRESLAAIRSLCEVVLGGEGSREEKVSSPVMPVASVEGKLLEEDDANGGSIFDF
ncbi:YwdI family protein [Sporosarcina sp. 179-K 3D1 HS]|uniref:YwdI family protein n=1 Tax=Sporosarcina sp. 179-K 3D1 HS TaxID=3232169 RepID=UPI0039A012E5